MIEKRKVYVVLGHFRTMPGSMVEGIYSNAKRAVEKACRKNTDLTARRETGESTVIGRYVIYPAIIDQWEIEAIMPTAEDLRDLATDLAPAADGRDL
jgi:hypothetical protein